MRILVTNDDGIHSPGLAVTEDIARSLSDDVWVVAPENEQSGASHSLTLASPLRLRKLEERRYAVTRSSRNPRMTKSGRRTGGSARAIPGSRVRRIR